jgi:hypothetical protein
MPLLLAPALWNGFPLMFFDSGAFIEQAVTGGFVPERSVFYSWFLALLQLRLSLWIPVAAQAAIAVWVIAEFARAVAPDLAPERSPGKFAALMLALAVGTGLPWYAGQVLADILAPLMVLSLYLLGFHAAALGWGRRAGFLAVAVLAATSHASHLGLMGGLAAVTALAQWIAPKDSAPGPAPEPRPRLALPTLAFALSLALIVASNFARTGEVFFSRAGSAFVLARLMQDGIVKRLLDDTCPEAGWRLCPHKDALPRTANDWLWGQGSPFWELGAFTGTEAESRRMIAESLRRYPLMHLKTAAKATADQFALFRTGDGIEPQNHLLAPIFAKFLPGQLAAYNAARQQNRLISFAWIDPLHRAVGWLSILAAAAIPVLALRGPRRRRDDRLFLPAFLLLALLGNAFICGALSNPHDRYQSRLIWPVALAVLLLAARGSSTTEAQRHRG